MFIRRQPVPAQSPEPKESPGLLLEVRLSDKKAFQLKLSEPVALKMSPWLIGLAGLSLMAVSIGWWYNHTTSQATTTLPPTVEIQPRK